MTFLWLLNNLFVDFGIISDWSKAPSLWHLWSIFKRLRQVEHFTIIFVIDTTFLAFVSET